MKRNKVFNLTHYKGTFARSDPDAGTPLEYQLKTILEENPQYDFVDMIYVQDNSQNVDKAILIVKDNGDNNES